MLIFTANETMHGFDDARGLWKRRMSTWMTRPGLVATALKLPGFYQRMQGGGYWFGVGAWGASGVGNFWDWWVLRGEFGLRRLAARCVARARATFAMGCPDCVLFSVTCEVL